MMDESETQESETAPRRKRDWDGVAAVIAAFVGLLALLVSAYTANVQRQQVRAQVWTRLYFGRDDGERTLMVTNKGVGPAHIESLSIYVDGKAQPDWEHVLAAVGMTKVPAIERSTINGMVVAAGERVNFLKLTRDEDWTAFDERAQGRIKLRACYCSVLDECLVFDQRAAHRGHGSISAEVTPVVRCDRVESDEFDN
jgi:hypothetical protein